MLFTVAIIRKCSPLLGSYNCPELSFTFQNIQEGFPAGGRPRARSHDVEGEELPGQHISIYQVVTAIGDKKGNNFKEDKIGSFSCFYRQGSAKVPRGLAGFPKTLADQDEGTPKNVRRSEAGILGDKSQESQNALIKIPGRPVSPCRRGSDPTLDCSNITSEEAKLKVNCRAPDGAPCQQDPGLQAEGDPPQDEGEDWIQG